MPNNFRAVTLFMLGMLTACASSPPVTTAVSTAQGPGAVSPQHAVEQFLAGVRAQDIQAISAVWGTSRGPVRDTMDRTELERRVIIMQGCLAHNQARIASERQAEGGRRVFGVALTRGSVSRQTTFTTIAGPGSRWYVENIDLNAVRDMCAEPIPAAR